MSSRIVGSFLFAGCDAGNTSACLFDSALGPPRERPAHLRSCGPTLKFCSCVQSMHGGRWIAIEVFKEK
jgi:hypothetical protein